jgi:Fic family protein
MADPLTQEHRERFVISSLMDEAISSSMLEGASTTVKVAKDMLRRGRKPRTQGERMVANNYRAILYVRERQHESLSLDFLLELHEILADGTIPPEDVGRLRTRADRVEIVDVEGETVFTPPDAETLHERLEAFFAFANNPSDDEEGAFMHPVIRGMLVHFQLSYLHPFCDGNGRTARILFLWSMLRRRYWLFEWLPTSKIMLRSPSQYARAFLYTETDEFDATYFLVYNARVISACRDTLHAFIAEKRREVAQARTAFSGNSSLNHRQQALLLHALRHPGHHYTIQSHQNSHGTAYQTARSDLLTLWEAGYLAKQQSGNKFVFIATDRLDTR